jgi:uncharacterized protein (DUF885 family)
MSHRRARRTGESLMKKLLVWGLLAVALGASVFLVNLFWFRPFSINLFFEREFIKFGLMDPEQMTVLGILDGTPFDYYNDELTDASIAQTERMIALGKRGLTTLREYDRASLTPDEQLSYDVFEWFLQNAVDGERFKFHDYAIIQNRGAYLGMVDFMSRVHRLESRKGAENYLVRLEAVANKLDQQLALARQQEAMGIVPARFIIRKTLMNLHNIRDVALDESLYYRPFTDKVDKLDELSADDRQSLKDRAVRIVSDSVYPAYDRTIGYLADLEQRATDEAGVWKLPDGDAYYQYCIRSNTTTDMSAEEIHRLGLSEVARIEAEMTAIFTGLGYDDARPAELLERIGEEPRFLKPDTDAARVELVSGYQHILDEIGAGIGKAFNKRPHAPLEVRRIPSYREDTAASHYSRPALDGSRPGVFFVNLSEVPPTWSMRTLAYHEGIPGHHFQIGLQMELSDVPTFRKIIPFTAYTEGWALYAERLAWETGFETDPYDNLGRLKAELFRAARLVVDTGIHHERWTREEAIAYFREHLGEDMVSEVERYVVWPGQALAYKIGMLAILKERERARQATGDAFDLRAFHDAVIGSGAMPLPILSRQVDRYIAEHIR